LYQQRWQECADAYRQALARQPGDASGWSNLGIVLWALQDLEGADEAYQRSLEISSEDLPTATNYARLLLDRKMPERALKILEGVLTRDPNLINGWIAAGDAFMVIGDDAQAAAAFGRAMELAP